MRPAAQPHPGRCIRRGLLLPATGAGHRCSRAEDQSDRGQHARASPLTRCNSQPRAIPWGSAREEGSSARNKARRCLGEAEGKRALFLGCPSFAGSCSLIAPRPPIFLPPFPASDPPRPRRPGKDAELLHPVWWAWPGAGSARGFLGRVLSFWPRTSHEARARPRPRVSAGQAGNLLARTLGGYLPASHHAWVFLASLPPLKGSA